MRRRGFAIITVVLSLALASVLVEGAARVYLLLHPVKEPLSCWDFRINQPLPYKDAEYFNNDFLMESMKCLGIKDFNCSKGLEKARDFSGDYINVSNNLRHTTGQPERARNRILLFGGSTMFCREVPDEYTIASILQGMINDHYGSAFMVENHGLSSLRSEDQTRHMKQVPIQPGDMVVFYDGVNDMVGVDSRIMEQQMPERVEAKGNLRRIGWTGRIMNTLFIRFGEKIAFLKVFFALRSRGILAKPVKEEEILTMLGPVRDSYEDHIRQAHQFVTSKEGHFYHFLQPSLFTLLRISPYEQELMENAFLVARASRKTHVLGYPMLRQALMELQKEGVNTTDLSHVLNERENKEEFYLDFCHVNHRANERIAKHMFEIIFAR